MALENISEVCSDMLRIAPGALHIQTFLGGGPPKPPSLPPIKCQNCSEDTKISIIFQINQSQYNGFHNLIKFESMK